MSSPRVSYSFNERENEQQHVLHTRVRHALVRLIMSANYAKTRADKTITLVYNWVEAVGLMCFQRLCKP